MKESPWAKNFSDDELLEAKYEIIMEHIQLGLEQGYVQMARDRKTKECYLMMVNSDTMYKLDEGLVQAMLRKGAIVEEPVH